MLGAHKALDTLKTDLTERGYHDDGEDENAKGLEPAGCCVSLRDVLMRQPQLGVLVGDLGAAKTSWQS